MIQSDWFWIKKDPEAPTVIDAKGLNRSNYPYFTDAESFSKVDDSVAYYEYNGHFVQCDILFEPTFLICDALQTLFQFIEPELQFKGVQLYSRQDSKRFATPMYWLPLLPFSDDAVSDQTQSVGGKPVKLVLNPEPLRDRRLIHCRLPAADIWLVSLEAAECLLRRQPIGIELEPVLIRQ